MLLQSCLNGSRRPDSHAALPVTPEQLARDARLVVSAGAGELHIHPRNADGEQSLAAHDVGVALKAVRAACPGVPVGVTTIATAKPDVAERLALVRAWDTLPSYASVNLSEEGAGELCAALFEMGVGIEAGLWSVADVHALVALGIGNRCLRVLIEVPGRTVPEALATAERMIDALDAGGINVPRLLHGFNVTAWGVLEAAATRGYDTRIGLEDTLQLPDGSPARDNAELVATARSIIERVGGNRRETQG